MATFIVAVVIAVVFGWAVLKPSDVEDVLFLANAGLYAEPWRILTSTLIHRNAPHFVFNLVTLCWFGSRVEARFGKRIFGLVCFGGLWTGQMLTLAAGMLPFHGVSGAVCGFYGFLLAADWKGGVYRTIRQRPAYWVYGAALVALFIADRLRLTPVANLNHLTAILYGSLIGVAATRSTGQRMWWTVVAALTVIITVAGAEMFERPWRGLAPLSLIDCSIARRPIGDVTANGFVRVVVIDRAGRPKTMSYVDVNGAKVVVSSNSRRTYRLLPYISTVWRIDDAHGSCRAQFEATASGTVDLN